MINLQKKYLALLLCCFFSMVLSAQTEARKDVLVVDTWGGECVAYRLATHPVMTVQGDSCVVFKTDETSIIYYAKDYVRFRFMTEEQWTPVESVKAESPLFAISDDAVRVENVSSSRVISIYSMDGRLVALGRPNAEGQVNINIANLQHGVYMVNTGKSNFKFLKR